MGSQVDSYFICVGSTDRGPATGKKARLQDTQNRWYPAMKAPPEIDRMTRAYLEAAKEAGMEIFASMRMNDIHDAWAPRLTYPLKMARPDLLLGARMDHAPDAVMRAFWSGFDYAREEVRQHFLDFIRTYCRQYDYDGLELDYFRHPLFFKLGEERQHLDTMTGFVRRVRGILREIGRERGRPYLLAIRVPDTPAMALRTGLDVEQWMKEGLLDLLIVGGGYMPYAGRLQTFVDLAHRYGIPAYPCINHFREPGGHAQPGLQLLVHGCRRGLPVQLLRSRIRHGRGAHGSASERSCRTAQGLEPDGRSGIAPGTGKAVPGRQRSLYLLCRLHQPIGGSFP